MKYDLEQRLIRFAVSIVKTIESLPQDRSCNHLAGQLVRSGTAPALLYGEAQSAESRKDFIHKMRIGLKELRETSVCLKIISEAGYSGTTGSYEKVINENVELISIFHKSILTATKNLTETDGRM
ncbi:MAG TPA: four helix bundle protein [Cyclobacteriaceae bacterium]|nr:four helix bundle protein [Cyclobacteriaceae bacterium]